MKKYLSIVAGVGILAFGMYNVHARSGITEGGVLGLSLLIYHWLGLSPGISCFLMDSAAMIAGAVIIKNNFLSKSILASACYAAWYLLFERFDPVLPDLSEHYLAAAVAGAVFVGVGVGLVVRQNCAAGGDDALALVFHKLTGKKVSAFYVMSDMTVLLLSLSYIPAREIGWSVLSVLLSSAIIELLRPREGTKPDTVRAKASEE